MKKCLYICLVNNDAKILYLISYRGEERGYTIYEMNIHFFIDGAV